jgi:hypothetical protein
MQITFSLELVITLVGIAGLIAGIILTLQTVKVLRPLGLQRRYWILVAFLGFFFMMYTTHVLDLLDIIILPVGSDMLVSIVYMGGAIYVVLVSFISLGLWRNVAGKPLTPEEARDLFATHVGNAPPIDTFSSEIYSVPCSFCGENIEFSLVDVVSSHADSIERGIDIQTGMGLKMIVVYPRHVCKDGLREIPVKLDDAYKYRSHGESRPV